ncbi:MAG: hypothetical protein DCC58_01285 [Chloroflexi bacterium]|nr:MAG: hypothetical protein DCC58_01285 [Chloroflexota bacterium]
MAAAAPVAQSCAQSMSDPRHPQRRKEPPVDHPTPSTSQRAASYAQRFSEINADVLATIEPLDDAQWFALCKAEQATVAAVVSHVAGSYRAIGGWIAAVAAGETPPPVTREMIDAGNARHAERHAQRPKAEALDAVRTNAAATAAMVRGLGDEQLARSAYLQQFGRSMTVAELIEDVLLQHVVEHLGSIRATLADVPAVQSNDGQS